MTGAPPKVFISYSHDVVEHQERVLGLADGLRADGIDAAVDQYNARRRRARRSGASGRSRPAEVVLMVCTDLSPPRQR